jgi:hypothetical protein
MRGENLIEGSTLMPMIQLLVHTESYAKDLCALLSREGCDVVRCAAPDFTHDGAIVADRRALDRHPALLEHPERVVLIAPNDSKFLSLLWQHNMRSVVFDTDPPGTVLLAILANEIGQGGAGGIKPKNNLVVLGSR